MFKGIRTEGSWQGAGGALQPEAARSQAGESPPEHQKETAVFDKKVAVSFYSLLISLFSWQRKMPGSGEKNRFSYETVFAIISIDFST